MLILLYERTSVVSYKNQHIRKKLNLMRWLFSNQERFYNFYIPFDESFNWFFLGQKFVWYIIAPPKGVTTKNPSGTYLRGFDSIIYG